MMPSNGDSSPAKKETTNRYQVGSQHEALLPLLRAARHSDLSAFNTDRNVRVVLSVCWMPKGSNSRPTWINCPRRYVGLGRHVPAGSQRSLRAASALFRPWRDVTDGLLTVLGDAPDVLAGGAADVPNGGALAGRFQDTLAVRIEAVRTGTKRHSETLAHGYRACSGRSYRLNSESGEKLLEEEGV
jgi:hypothetical protein